MISRIVGFANNILQSNPEIVVSATEYLGADILIVGRSNVKFITLAIFTIIRFAVVEKRIHYQ